MGSDRDGHEDGGDEHLQSNLLLDDTWTTREFGGDRTDDTPSDGGTPVTGPGVAKN